MKKTRSVATLVFLLLIGLAEMAGCGRERVSTAGTYYNQQNPEDYLQLKENGAFYLKEMGVGFTGEWEVEKDVLRLHLPQLGIAFEGELRGDTIIDNDGRIWVKRSGSLRSTPTSPKKAFIGKWKRGEAWIQFFADGTMRLGDDAGMAPGSYEVVDDDTIRINVPGKDIHVEPVVVSISEDTLTLTFSSTGQSTNFRRVAHPASAATPTRVPTPTPEAVLVSPTPTSLKPGDKFADQRERMVTVQLEDRNITDPGVLQAMRTVGRHKFVPPEYVEHAYRDWSLPIGYGQTISTPYIVAVMIELLELDRHSKVLEIGTGSGYQAAILSKLTDHVYTVEIVDPLCKAAKDRLARLGYSNVAVDCADGYYGWEDHAPYDAIIVTCAPDHIPQPLVNQLANGGRMVIPVGPPGLYQVLWKVERHGEDITSERLMGVSFMPMTGEH